MIRLLLATTAISALALGTPVALAQSSNVPSGALEEQKQPPKKGANTQTPTQGPAGKTAPAQGTHNGSPTGRSAQVPAAPPNGTQPPGTQAQQEQPGTQPPKAPQQLNGQARPQTPSTTGEMNNAPRNTGAGNQGPAAATPTKQSNPPPAAGRVGVQGRAQVTEQQRTQIRERIGGLHTQRLTRVDFSIDIGIAVPPSVQLYTLPLEIVEIVPEYRGYDYVIVGAEFIIINPGSLEIVAIIPV